MEISDFQVKETIGKTNWLERLTLADAVFGLIVLAAGIIRFAQLDALPLSDEEARAALAVWQFWQPGAAQVTVISPVYFSLTAVLTQILGFSDVVMRLVPAAFGLVLVTLPRFLQRQLGVMGALTATLLLAVSPLLVIISRTAGGQSAALFAVLLTAVAFLRYQETAESRWFYILAAAAGLGLTSDALFYTGLVTLGLAWILFYKIMKPQRRGERLTEDDEENAEPSTSLRFNPSSIEKRTALIVLISVFVLSGSLFLWYISGLGDTARLLGEWVALFGQADGRTISDPFLAFLRYEPALVILGLTTVIWTIWRGRPFTLLLLYWGLAILLVMLVQRGVMVNAALLTLPITLLVGVLSQHILSRRWSKYTGFLTLALFLALSVMIINFARYLRVVTYQPQDLQYIFAMMMAFFIALAVIYILSAYDVTAVFQGMFLTFLAFFLVAQWSQSWQLAQYHGNDSRERWVAVATNEGARLLRKTAREVSYQISSADNQLHLLNTSDSPALAWYLREMRQMDTGQTVPATADYEAIIAPADAQFSLGNAYTGSDFNIRNVGVISAAPNPDTAVFDALRWWFFHESPDAIQSDPVVFWVRADLIEK